MRLENGSIRLIPLHQAVTLAQKSVRQFVSEGVSLVDMLIQEQHRPPVAEYVLDASALLALLNAEIGADSVQDFLPDASISTVNLAEVVTRLSAIGMPENDIRNTLTLLGLEVIHFDEEQAYQAGLLYSYGRVYGLSR